jgi:hypothetical protein
MSGVLPTDIKSTVQLSASDDHPYCTNYKETTQIKEYIKLSTSLHWPQPPWALTSIASRWQSEHQVPEHQVPPHIEKSVHILLLLIHRLGNRQIPLIGGGHHPLLLLCPRKQNVWVFMRVSGQMCEFWALGVAQELFTNRPRVDRDWSRLKLTHSQLTQTQVYASFSSASTKHTHRRPY